MNINPTDTGKEFEIQDTFVINENGQKGIFCTAYAGKEARR